MIPLLQHTPPENSYVLLCNSKRIVIRIILCVIRSREKNYSFYNTMNTLVRIPLLEYPRLFIFIFLA